MYLSPQNSLMAKKLRKALPSCRNNSIYFTIFQSFLREFTLFDTNFLPYSRDLLLLSNKFEFYRLTLRGHVENMTVSSLVALENGDLASGSFDKTIKVWNTTNGTCKRTVDINDYINSMASISESEVAVGLSANDIQMWNIQTGEPRNVLTVEQDKNEYNIKALKLLPNGDLASASSDAIVRIWNVKTGTLKASLKGHDSSVCALAVLDSLRLVSGSADNSVKVWSYWMSTGSGARSEHVR